MTGFISFTTDSFKKRKELLHLFYIQVFATFVLYYLIVLADILIKSFYNSLNKNLINASITNFWGGFFIILTVVSIVFAGMMVLYTIRLMVFYQTKEISIMVAVGGLIETIENFYLVQLVLMCLISNFVGLILAYVLIFLSFGVTGIFIPFKLPLILPFPDYTLVIIFVIFFFATYMISAKMVSNTVNRYHDDLSQDKIDFNNGRDGNIIARMFIWGKRSKEGFLKITTRLSRLNIMRNSFVFIISIIINLVYAFFIISLIFGTLVVSDTASNITYTGIGGDNTAIIVKKDLTNYFTQAFQIDSNNNQTNFNYTYSLFNFYSLMPILKSFNISSIDDRIASPMVTTAFNPPINIDPNVPVNTPGSSTFGPVTLTPLVVALNTSNSIPFWNYYGSNPKTISGKNVFVGEDFAYKGFRTPMDSILSFNSASSYLFTVKSIVLDPLFKGNTVYVSMATFQSIFKPDSSQRNLVFIKIPSGVKFSSLESAITHSNPDLSLVPLSGVVSYNADFNNYLSLNILLIGVPLLVIYFFINDFYNRQILEERKQQLNLFKVLGITLENYSGLILKEIDAFSLWGLVIGYILGVFFIVELTVPFPVISLLTVIISIGLIVGPFLVVRKRLHTMIDSLYNSYIES